MSELRTDEGAAVRGGAPSALTTVRARIATLVKRYPDSSHGEDYRNGGLESALHVIDLALDAPCRFSRTAYGQWCDLHHSPVSEDHPMVGDRCNGYRFAADQALARPEPDGLDEAWAEAEAALPEGWVIGSLSSADAFVMEKWRAKAVMPHNDPDCGLVYDDLRFGAEADTPAAALRALAVRLKAEGSGPQTGSTSEPSR